MKPSIDKATPQPVRIYPTSCDLHAESHHTACAEVSNSYDQLRTQNAALRDALEKISERPHESTCVSEMGYECDCPIGIADAALEEVK